MKPVMIASLSIGLAVGALAGVTSCVIADPPPEIPEFPRHRPMILHGSVVPPTFRVLTSIDGPFIVPIELLDQDTAFEYCVFVDYDYAGSANPSPRMCPRVEPDPGSVDGGIRIVSFTLDSLEPNRCHVIEFIVALSFDRISTHTPDSFGGDSVTWFYNPSGDLDGCPSGPWPTDGGFPDAGCVGDGCASDGGDDV